MTAKDDAMKQIDKAMKEIVYPVQAKLVRETALRALSGIEAATPVRTGRARSNWNISSGTPDFSTTPPVPEGETQRPADQSEKANGLPTDKTIYISNGLPYIQRLNEGYSAQAPANFVEEGVTLAIRNAKAAAKRGAR